MNVKKRFACLLLTLAVLVSMSACSLGTKIPDATSEDWSLYAKYIEGSKMVVNGYGQPEYDYAFDKKGNVIDINKTIIIGAENVADFIDIESITLDDEKALEIMLDTQIKEVENGSSGALYGDSATARVEEPISKNVRVQFNLNPENAMCKSVIASCEDAGAIELSGVDSEGKVTLHADEETSYVVLDFIAKDEGAAKISMASEDGNTTEEFNVTVTLNDTPINEDAFQNSMSVPPTLESNDVIAVQGSGEVSVDTVVTVSDAIPTTENTPGWVNGSKVNLREEPTTTSNILGTYTSGKPLAVLGSANGWSKVQIEGKIGYVKTVYVTLTDPNPAVVTGNGQNNTNQQAVNGVAGSSTVVSSTNNGTYSNYSGGTASGSQSSGTGSNGTSNPTDLQAPIASNDGQDHGYAFSTEAEPLGSASHEHDFKIASVVDPTESSKGYTVYVCSCGATYRGDFTDYIGESSKEHVHSYTDKVVEPTCEEIGYTIHTCPCGDSYKDSFVNAKGHSFVTRVLEDGSVEYTCSVCGYSFVEEE